MPKKVEIGCDGCSKDLTYTSNFEDYYLVVTYASKRHRPTSFAVTAMAKSPPVEREYFFCDLQCLDHWTDRRRHFSAAYDAWFEAHKEDLGGGITRCPHFTEELEAKFRSAALEAFPMYREASK